MTSSSSACHSRTYLAVVAAVAAGVCAAAAASAERELAARDIGVGPLTLRLVHNEGLAFSVGRSVPGAVQILTALVTAALVVAGWRLAPGAARLQLFGGGLTLGGGIANLVDRLPDGRVTDYLSVGWWPTFNLPDVLVFTGAGLVLLCVLHAGPEPVIAPPARTPP